MIHSRIYIFFNIFVYKLFDTTDLEFYTKYLKCKFSQRVVPPMVCDSL